MGEPDRAGLLGQGQGGLGNPAARAVRSARQPCTLVAAITCSGPPGTATPTGPSGLPSTGKPPMPSWPVPSPVHFQHRLGPHPPAHDHVLAGLAASWPHSVIRASMSADQRAPSRTAASSTSMPDLGPAHRASPPLRRRAPARNAACSRTGRACLPGRLAAPGTGLAAELQAGRRDVQVTGEQPGAASRARRCSGAGRPGTRRRPPLVLLQAELGQLRAAHGDRGDVQPPDIRTARRHWVHPSPAGCASPRPGSPPDPVCPW